MNTCIDAIKNVDIDLLANEHGFHLVVMKLACFYVSLKNKDQRKEIKTHMITAMKKVFLIKNQLPHMEKYKTIDLNKWFKYTCSRVKRLFEKASGFLHSM